jgi:hypothetical protein
MSKLTIVNSNTGEEFCFYPFEYEGGKKPYRGFDSAFSLDKNGKTLFLLISIYNYSEYSEKFNTVIKHYLNQFMLNKSELDYKLREYFLSDDDKLCIVFN